MAVDITIPADEKIIVAVSGGLDSAILWYSVYKECLDRGQDCLAVTAPQLDHSVEIADTVVSYVHSVLGGTINETLALGTSGFDPHSEDSSFVVGRMFNVLNNNTETYGSHVFTGQALDYDPTGEITEYKTYRWGTDNIESLLATANPNLTFHHPFSSKNKTHILSHMNDLDADVLDNLLQITSSCFKPSVTEGSLSRCGECPSCIEREWACNQTGITDTGTK